MTVANWFWPDDAAPWESVDAFYYPNAADLTQHDETLGLNNKEQCLFAVRVMANNAGDPTMMRGDYECGVGRVDRPQYGGVRVYRITVE